MATIFISYRRQKDGADKAWARGLRDRLRATFSVFLDDALKPGDQWASVLEQQIAECEIFIAFIGPTWTDDQNFGRLNDEEDWVRKEVLAALRTEGALIIPVVIIGREEMKPVWDRLPGALKPLGSAQAEFIDQDGWDDQVDAFCQRLQQILAERQERRGAAAVPLQLPYLCNRGDHEEKLRDKIVAAGGNRTLACVLAGRNLDGHQAFVDRLQSRRVLENALQATTRGVGFYELEFMREMMKRKDYPGFLRWAIRRRVLQKPDATDRQVDDLLKNPGLPTVLVLEVNWEDRQAYGDDLVPSLVHAWFGLFGDPPIEPSQPLLFWINLAFPEAQEPEALQADWALPNLTPITNGDIGRWLALPEVRPHVVKFEGRLREIGDDPKWRRADNTLSMLKFAEAVHNITNAA